MDLLDPLTWAILLLLIGCGLIVMEIFIPSGGLLGFLASVAVVGSVVMAFRRDSTTGLSFIVITLLAVPAVVVLAFKVWPSTPMGRAFLGEVLSEEELSPEEPRRELVGRLGIAKSMMLPAGAVWIDGHMIDAITRGTPIEKGETVVVVEVKGNRVVVRLAQPEEAARANVDVQDLLDKPIDELGLDPIDDPLA